MKINSDHTKETIARSHAQFDTVKWKTQLPKYFKECFDALSGLNNSTPVTFDDIMNEIIWNSKFICIDKKSDYWNDLVHSES